MGYGGMVFGLNYLLVILLVIVPWLMLALYGIKFFKKAAEYYQTELDNRQKKDAQMQELLAKFDQLVDVLKVK